MPTGVPPDQTLGAALREAREAAELTVERVSSETKIRATLIRDLEADQFASSGGLVYARGHVKSIASTLHIDPAPLLTLFDRAAGTPEPPPLAAPASNKQPFKQVKKQVTPPVQQPTLNPVLDPAPHPISKPVQPPAPASARTPMAPAPIPVTVPASSLGHSEFALSAAAALRPERHGPRWGIAIAAAAVLLLALVGIGTLNGSGAAKKDDVAAPSVSAPVVVPSPQQTAPKVTATLPPVTGAQLRVSIVSGTSWVSISNASSTLFQGLLSTGQFKDFHDPSRLKVVLGFAPAVNLSCNNHDSTPGASSGRHTQHYLCTSSGLTSAVT